jgi:Polysaccharide pyruvyl transferase
VPAGARMILKYCPVSGGNFGDDLNTLMWEELFPDITKLQDEMVFYGIGTLLDGRHDQSVKKIVLGTGIGEANAALPDPNWEFRWVRGPLSAREFGLPRELALGDPALLWPELQPRSTDEKTGPVGLIPHYRTWDSFDWARVAENAGMLAINPRQSPAEVVSQMQDCSRIMTESLHGGICADAMNIPWAPCILAHRFNEFKWHDWLATVNRTFAPFVSDRPLVRSVTRSKSMANRLARLAKYKLHTRHPSLRPVAPATAADANQVSEDLEQFARCEDNFTCSKPSDVARQREQMLQACQKFAVDYQLRFTPQAWNPQYQQH